MFPSHGVDILSSTLVGLYRRSYVEKDAYELYIKVKKGDKSELTLERLIEACAPLAHMATKHLHSTTCEEARMDILSVVMCNLWKYLKDGNLNDTSPGDFTAHMINYCRLVARGAMKEIQPCNEVNIDTRDMYRRYELSPQKAYEVRSLFQSIPKMIREFIGRKDRFRFLAIESQSMTYLLKCIVTGTPPAKAILTSWSKVKLINVDFCIEYYSVLCRWALYIIRQQYRDVLVHLPKDYTTYSAEADVMMSEDDG